MKQSKTTYDAPRTRVLIHSAPISDRLVEIRDCVAKDIWYPAWILALNAGPDKPVCLAYLAESGAKGLQCFQHPAAGTASRCPDDYYADLVLGRVIVGTLRASADVLVLRPVQRHVHAGTNRCLDQYMFDFVRSLAEAEPVRSSLYYENQEDTDGEALGTWICEKHDLHPDVRKKMDDADSARWELARARYAGVALAAAPAAVLSGLASLWKGDGP